MVMPARNNELGDEAESIAQSATLEAAAELVIEDGVRFDRLLDEKSRDRDFGKRDRTRFQVMACVARQLLDEFARNPSIEALLDETGLSRGTFYNNFTDMDSAVETVLGAFFQALWAHRPRADASRPRRENFDPLLEANLWYCQAYETNAGLFAAFARVAAYTPTLLRMREKMNASWVERVIGATSKKYGCTFSPSKRKAFQGALRLMVAMSIEALRERYIHRDELLSNSFPDAVAMAVGLTAIWQQTIDSHVKA